MKTVIVASNESMVANLKTETVDFSNVGNRRFMYNPKTGTLLLGSEDIEKGCKKIISSHAEEFHDAGIAENFDDFLRGWLGYNRREYKHGILHFTPHIIKTQFDRGFDTLLAFVAQIGIDGKTKVRGFITFNEVPLKELLPNSCTK